MDFAHFKKLLHLSSCPALPMGAICHLPPLLSPPTFLKTDGEPRAGHSASLFHCLLPGGRRRACLLIAQIPPSFFTKLAGPLSQTGAKVAPMLSSLPSISRVEGSRYFLHLTPCVFRRPSPTHMMNTTSFQISHPLSAAAKLARNKIINTGRREWSLCTQNFHIQADVATLILIVCRRRK